MTFVSQLMHKTFYSLFTSKESMHKFALFVNKIMPMRQSNQNPYLSTLKVNLETDTTSMIYSYEHIFIYLAGPCTRTRELKLWIEITC